MNFEKSKVAAICKAYGQFVLGLPDTLAPSGVLWALSGVESSFGANCNPRHEVEYCPQVRSFRHYEGDMQTVYVDRKGLYASDAPQVKAFDAWGCMACCSFTPWQIMLANAPTASPVDLLTNLDRCAQAAVALMNRKFTVAPPLNLPAVARLWNGAGVSEQYIADLAKYYQEGLPA